MLSIVTTYIFLFSAYLVSLKSFFCTVQQEVCCWHLFVLCATLPYLWTVRWSFVILHHELYFSPQHVTDSNHKRDFNSTCFRSLAQPNYCRLFRENGHNTATVWNWSGQSEVEIPLKLFKCSLISSFFLFNLNKKGISSNESACHKGEII